MADVKTVLAVAGGAVLGIVLSKLFSRTKKEEEGWVTEDQLNDGPVRFRYSPPTVDKVAPTSPDDPILEKDAVRKALSELASATIG